MEHYAMDMMAKSTPGKEGAIPQKVQISIVTDKNDKDLIRQIKRSGATEISLSPDAKEIAFVLRGDVYVTSTEYNTTKQITNTPQQERDIHFSPDGRSIGLCFRKKRIMADLSNQSS